MTRKIFGKVVWVGRTASTVFGLALVMALLFGAASTALGANGGSFILGKPNNMATKATALIGKVAADEALEVKNPSGGARWVLAWATRWPTRLPRRWPR